MGYYTNYSISFIGKDDRIASFKRDLLKASRGNDSRYEVDLDLKELLEEEFICAKLYDLENWISDVAPKYADVLVILEGDGEQSDDLWEARWRGDNYEHQDAKIPPFTNYNLLTEKEKASVLTRNKK